MKKRKLNILYRVGIAMIFGSIITWIFSFDPFALGDLSTCQFVQRTVWCWIIATGGYFLCRDTNRGHLKRNESRHRPK